MTKDKKPETFWFRCGGSKIGTSHIRAGSECQDRAACSVYSDDGSETVIAIVSDGAGSAKYSGYGAQIACTSFVRSARQYLSSGGKLGDLTDETARHWVENIRERIQARADAHETTARQHAATIAALISDGSQTVCMLIGDSLIALKTHGEDWELPLAPMHGDYASTTYFLTELPEPRLAFIKTQAPIEKAALFTDGLERIALAGPTKAIKGTFLDSIFEAVSGSISPGYKREVSQEVREWLGSDVICEHTDDDKTLILIQHISEE